jgi:hypothetical protein
VWIGWKNNNKYTISAEKPLENVTGRRIKYENNIKIVREIHVGCWDDDYHVQLLVSVLAV